MTKRGKAYVIGSSVALLVFLGVVASASADEGDKDDDDCPDGMMPNPAIARLSAQIAAARIFWATGTGLSAEPSRSAHAVALAAREPGQLTVLDLDYRPSFWPSQDEAGRQLRAQRRSLKLIYLTMNPSPDLAAEALRLGAAGYVLKSSAAHELTQAIREALKGRSYITPLVTRDVVGSLMQQRPVRQDLTTRQREVLQLLAEGRSMKEVGAILNLTARTVAFHKYRMMEQLRLKTTAELVQFAVRQGVVS